jgi:uncharacterized protein involved in exopolysaccharide biosynthesis
MPKSPEDLPTLDLKGTLPMSLKVALGAGLVTAAVTLFLPNDYRSESRILPVEARSAGNLGNLATAAAALGVSVPGQEGSDANFVDILNSRSLREGLLQTEFHFHDRGWLFGPGRERRETLLSYLDQKNQDRAVKKLGTLIFASRDLKSKVITLAAETHSPELSQQLVQRATALLEQFLLQKGRTRGGEKALFATARLTEARREMDQAEEVLRRFLNLNRNYQTSADPSVRLQGARHEMELKLRQQLVTTLALSREQSLLEEKDDKPILNVLDPGNLPLEKNGPARSLFVLLAALVAGAGTWGWLNRAWLHHRLLQEGSEPSGGDSPNAMPKRLEDA